MFIPFYHHEKHESVKSILLHFDPSFCTFPQFNRSHLYRFSLLFFSLLCMCVYVFLSVLILFFPSSFSSFSLSLCCCLEIHDTDKNGVDKLKEMETNFEHLGFFSLVFHFARIFLLLSLRFSQVPLYYGSFLPLPQLLLLRYCH